ncbi:hypothetical protein [Agilicoccus flavus]|uniref:hypothetical protein n=1 Tax=Agilicoccus flavus TaxID=2775968 RepID=UPI001CF6E8BC|nr:hypothetical protein [Agilicoccus flavus]
MPDLPTSVRLSLWATRAFAGGLDLSTALRLAAPDADHLTGGEPTLAAWRDLGERAVLVALPRPGRLHGLPRGDADFTDAALEAGECVYVPGVGGALVPDVREFGPAGDTGLAVSWVAHGCDPTPAHVLDAWSLRDADRTLRGELAAAVELLERSSTTPWASRGLRDLADEQLGAGRWGLPDDLPAAAYRLLRTAATLAHAARLGLAAPDDSLEARSATDRADALRRLGDVADTALAHVTNVAALHLAGYRPGRDD